MRLGALLLLPSDNPVSGVMVAGRVVDGGGGGTTVGLVVVVVI